MLDASIIHDIAKRISNTFYPEKIILFGSYADGTQKEDSDIDLLIIQDSDVPIQQRGFEIRMTLRDFKIPFDIIVYTPQEYDLEKKKNSVFMKSIITKGKVLYERLDG